MAVADGAGVSIGAWNDDSEHEGLYYNRELKLQDRDYWSYSVQLTDAQLGVLSTYILGHDQWSPSYNCAVFAAAACNTVATPQFNQAYFSLPADLANSIQTMASAEYGKCIPQYYPVYHANGYSNLTYSVYN